MTLIIARLPDNAAKCSGVRRVCGGGAWLVCCSSAAAANAESIFLGGEHLLLKAPWRGDVLWA